MPPQSGAAAVFVDRDYGGAYAILEVGGYNLAQSPAGSVGNDTVSSLQVADGYIVTVFTNPDFSGDAVTFGSDTPYVGDALNEKISSIRVSSAGGGQQVVFIQPPSYHG